MLCSQFRQLEISFLFDYELNWTHFLVEYSCLNFQCSTFQLYKLVSKQPKKQIHGLSPKALEHTFTLRCILTSLTETFLLAHSNDLVLHSPQHQHNTTYPFSSIRDMILTPFPDFNILKMEREVVFPPQKRPLN